MILNGLKLLIHPQKAWDRFLADQDSHAPQLIAAAITAATIPAAAVVSGHLLSATLGYAAQATAVQRAAIGFVSVAVGALAMVPALSLVFLKTGTDARVDMTPKKATAAAMAIVWSTWLCGVVLAIPPLLNTRPEYGELAWLTLSIMSAYRVLSQTVCSGITVSRRWRSKFAIESMVAFVILFIAIPVVPPLVMRFLVGVTGQILYGAPPDAFWPHPPAPSW